MKRNHHYIPVFYQKKFSSNDKSIGKWIVDSNNYIPYASIKKTGYIEYLYGKTENIENALMMIEKEASRAISRIIDSGKAPEIDSTDYEIILMFILVMEARVLKQAHASNKLLDVQMKTMLQMEIEHDKLDMEVSDLDNVDINLNIPNLIQIRSALTLWEILRDLKMCLICNDTDRQFITSDNPVIRYNYMYNVRNYTVRNYGLGNMGLQMFFPITPNMCIYIYDDIMYDNIQHEDGNFHITKSREVDKFNKLVYMNSYDFLLFNPNIKESYLREITSGNSNLKNCENEIVAWGPKDSKLIITGFASVNKSFKFSFCKIRKEFINMPLPPHMAGPIRPYAKQFEVEGQTSANTAVPNTLF